MIPLLVAGAVAGAAGGLFGSLGRNAAARKKQQGIKSLQQENENWFNRRYNEDATQRADAQRLLRMTEEELRRRNKAAEGRRAMMGGTEESVAAEKERNNRAYADVVSQIAAQGEARKDRIEQQYLNRKNHLGDAYYDVEGEKANGYDVAGKMIGGAASGLSSFGSLASLFKKES